MAPCRSRPSSCTSSWRPATRSTSTLSYTSRSSRCVLQPDPSCHHTHRESTPPYPYPQCLISCAASRLTLGPCNQPEPLSPELQPHYTHSDSTRPYPQCPISRAASRLTLGPCNQPETSTLSLQPRLRPSNRAAPQPHNPHHPLTPSLLNPVPNPTPTQDHTEVPEVILSLARRKALDNTFESSPTCTPHSLLTPSLLNPVTRHQLRTTPRSPS